MIKLITLYKVRIIRLSTRRTLDYKMFKLSDENTTHTGTHIER